MMAGSLNVCPVCQVSFPSEGKMATSPTHEARCCSDKCAGKYLGHSSRWAREVQHQNGLISNARLRMTEATLRHAAAVATEAVMPELEAEDERE